MPSLSDQTRRTRDMLRFALLVTVAIVINYFDPPLPFLPGAKLGLSQVSTMLCLEIYGSWAAVVLVLLRVVATGLLKANLMSITSLLSLAGSLGAIAVMVTLRMLSGKRLGVPTLSTIGGVCNNVSQYLLLLITNTVGKLWYYLPALVVAGGAAGYLVGTLSLAVLSRLSRALHGGATTERQ